MKVKFISFIILFIISNSIQAQMTDWNWSDYKIKFKVHSSMKVTENNAEKFIAESSDINLTIFPRKGENLDVDQLKSLLRKWARESSVKDLTEPTYLDDLNGYWGYSIEGNKENSKIFQMLIIDPDYPEINFYIWIAYNEANTDIALDILLSFKPL